MTQRSFDDPRYFTRRANQISKRASKQRRRLPVLQPQLVADAFTPRTDIPATRADCPTGYCPHLRCRWHLALEDAEHRAGRPGLSSVPRDARGLTISQPGHAGTDRPGTTWRPTWLHVRGMHIEREVKVYVTEDLELVEMRDGTLDYWLARLHEGEPIECYDTLTLGLGDEPLLVALATLRDGAIWFDRALPEYVVRGSSGLRLVRVRPVPSCALDEIERRGKHSNQEVGDCIGRHRTLAARVVPAAMAHAIEVAEDMGMTAQDLMRGLRELGAGL